mgnify:CR=1 FL=1
MSTIAENIAAIRARIDAAARTTGRTGADITLVAATKMNDAARVREAVAESGVLGAFTGGITASAAGIAAAIFFGFLVALIFKPKDKS